MGINCLVNLNPNGEDWRNESLAANKRRQAGVGGCRVVIGGNGPQREVGCRGWLRGFEDAPHAASAVSLPAPLDQGLYPATRRAVQGRLPRQAASESPWLHKVGCLGHRDCAPSAKAGLASGPLSPTQNPCLFTQKACHKLPVLRTRSRAFVILADNDLIYRAVQPTYGPERSGMLAPFATPRGRRKQRRSTRLLAASGC